jgi:hypothetical protein
VESDFLDYYQIPHLRVKAFITALLLRVTAQDTLMIPLSLNGNSAHVRRLVVHLPPMFLTARGDHHGCSEGVRRMELLELSFPWLEICICLISIASFWSVLRELSHTKTDTVKEGLAQVIAAFLEFGPGRRRLVRCNATGPLV